MSDRGWIKLHRTISESVIWTNEPFSRGQAWVDLLLMVNHDDKKIMFNGDIITCKRGSRITSIRKLSERWKWSRDKTKRFLKALESDGMIALKTDQKKTTINVVNYSVYQDTQATKKPQKSHRTTTEKPLTDTNKNDKECKEDKKKDIGPSPSAILSETEKEEIEILGYLVGEREYTKEEYRKLGYS